MPELGDLEGGPIVVRQCRDQAGDHAGFAHVPRLAADYDDCHKIFVEVVTVCIKARLQALHSGLKPISILSSIWLKPYPDTSH